VFSQQQPHPTPNLNCTMKITNALLSASLHSGAVLAAAGPGTPPELFDWEKAQLTQDTTSHGHLDKYLKFHEGAQPSVLVDRACRVFPGDSDWPSADVWREFNTTLQGALIKAVPASSVCYKTEFNNYDVSRCNAVSGNWSTGFDR